MKKVKEMAVCMEKGKVCFRVRDAYNQLIEVLSSMEELKDYGQTETMAYEVAHTAMLAKKNELCLKIHETCLGCEIETAKKAANKAYKNLFVAIRVATEANNDVLLNMVLEDKNISIDEYSRIVKEAQEADEAYIVADKALDGARELLRDAIEIQSAKQELFDAMYPEV